MADNIPLSGSGGDEYRSGPVGSGSGTSNTGQGSMDYESASGNAGEGARNSSNDSLGDPFSFGDKDSSAGGSFSQGLPGAHGAESTGEASGNLLSSAGGGLASVGYNAIALGINSTRWLKSMGRKMLSRIAGALLSAGSGLSGITAGALSPGAGAAVAGGGSVAALAATSVLVVPMLQQNPYRDEWIDECTVDERGQGVGGDHVDVDAGMEENAKKIYGALSYAGFSDEGIAAILGNWSHESGLDSTSVETISDEKYHLGAKKKKAVQNDFDISKIDSGYAAQFPNIKKAGIGYGQWTNERNTNLVKFAESHGKDWHDPEVQLAFAMSKEEGSRADVFTSMKDEKDVDKATEKFLTKWEGINDGTLPKRQEYASKWYAKMSGWDKDPKLGKSLLDMSETGKASANGRAQQQEIQNCSTERTAGGNEDIATAVATISWRYEKDGHGNKGTDIYRYMRDEIFPGDFIYASCDRTAATAIRWAGADDGFPVGATGQQYEYALSSPKWKEIKGWDNTDESMAKPGDIAISNGEHIYVYTGAEVWDKVFGDDHEKNAKVGAGSYMDRSPTPQTWEVAGPGDSRPFKLFRSTGNESNSKYVDIKPPSHMKPGEGDKNSGIG